MRTYPTFVLADRDPLGRTFSPPHPGCAAWCDADDVTAPARHALRDVLAAIGIESDEEYLGAGNYAVIVPDTEGDWFLSNMFDAEPEDWSASYESLDGLHCVHDLGTPSTPLETVAARFRADCLFGKHEHPDQRVPTYPD